MYAPSHSPGFNAASISGSRIARMLTVAARQIEFIFVHQNSNLKLLVREHISIRDSETLRIWRAPIGPSLAQLHAVSRKIARLVIHRITE